MSLLILLGSVWQFVHLAVCANAEPRKERPVAATNLNPLPAVQWVTAGDQQTTIVDLRGFEKNTSSLDPMPPATGAGQWTAILCRYPNPNPIWSETKSAEQQQVEFKWDVPLDSGIYQWRLSREISSATSRWWSPLSKTPPSEVVQTRTYYVTSTGVAVAKPAKKSTDSGQQLDVAKSYETADAYESVGRICPSQSSWSVIGNWPIVDSALLMDRTLLHSLDQFSGRAIFETFSKERDVEVAQQAKPVRPKTQKTAWGDVSVLPPGHAFAASLPAGSIGHDHLTLIEHPADQPLHLSVQWIPDADPNHRFQKVIRFQPEIESPAEFKVASFGYLGFGSGQIRIVNLDQHNDARFSSIEVRSRSSTDHSSKIAFRGLAHEIAPRDCLWFSSDEPNDADLSKWSTSTIHLGHWLDHCEWVRGAAASRSKSTIGGSPAIWIELPGEVETPDMYAAIAADIAGDPQLIIAASEFRGLLKRREKETSQQTPGGDVSHCHWIVLDEASAPVSQTEHSSWIQQGLDINLLRQTDTKLAHWIDRSRLDQDVDRYEVLPSPDGEVIQAIAIEMLEASSNPATATGENNWLHRGQIHPAREQFLIRRADRHGWRQNGFEERLLAAWRTVNGNDWISVASVDAQNKTAEVFVSPQSEGELLIVNRAPWRSMIELKFPSTANDPTFGITGNGSIHARGGGYHHIDIPAGGLAIIRPDQLTVNPIELQSWTSVVAGGIDVVDAIKSRVTKMVERVGRLNDPPSVDDLFSDDFSSGQEAPSIVGDTAPKDSFATGLAPWLHTQHPVGCVRAVMDPDPLQNRCAELSSHGGQTARTWMVSETLDPEQHGALAVSLRCRAVTGVPEKNSRPINGSAGEVAASQEIHLKSINRQGVPLRLSIEGIQDSTAIRMSRTIELPPDDLWHDKSMVLEIGGLIPDKTESLRLTIDLLGPGTVRLDDIRIHSRFATAAQRADLQQLSFLAIQGLKRGNLTHSAQLLQNPYSNELLFRHEYQTTPPVTAPSPADQKSKNSRVVNFAGVLEPAEARSEPKMDKPNTDQVPSVTQRIRNWLPRPMRF